VIDSLFDMAIIGLAAFVAICGVSALIIRRVFPRDEPTL
jgi:hypothetical protein